MRLGVVVAALVALMLAVGGAAAQEYRLGSLVIVHPYAPATATRAKTAAGYLTVRNEGSAPDRLLAVRADFPEVSLHVVETDAEGVTRMLPVDGIAIPAGATVQLEPRGAHVMFMGLSAPFEAGQEVAATLVFEKAGEIAVRFPVEARGGAGGGHDAEGAPATKVPGSGG
ncbi:MAG: copper chaperone PCu(A)C [Amaricoccus sp.]